MQQRDVEKRDWKSSLRVSIGLTSLSTTKEHIVGSRCSSFLSADVRCALDPLLCDLQSDKAHAGRVRDVKREPLTPEQAHTKGYVLPPSSEDFETVWEEHELKGCIRTKTYYYHVPTHRMQPDEPERYKGTVKELSQEDRCSFLHWFGSADSASLTSMHLLWQGLHRTRS